MDHIFLVLENGDDCQYSIQELTESYLGEVPHIKTIMRRLEKYGCDIIISTNTNSEAVVYLRTTGQRILSDQWYIDRRTDEAEERSRIVIAATKIIKGDMNSKVSEGFQYNFQRCFRNMPDFFITYFIHKPAETSYFSYCTVEVI